MNILWGIMIGTGFVLWPIIGKFSGATSAWVTILVAAGTLVSCMPLSLQSAIQSGVSIRSTLILLLAGAVNGIAFYFYSVHTANPSAQTGTFMVTVIVAMLLLTPILSYFVNHEVLTLKQFTGMACAALTVYLLS
ncbi:MAG TPA: hypothetical protein VF829_01255 [Candidatus Paceibacterota bacterium]